MSSRSKKMISLVKSLKPDVKTKNINRRMLRSGKSVSGKYLPIILFYTLELLSLKIIIIF